VSQPSSPTPFGPRRLLWLVVIKVVLLLFAVLVALRVYGLI
jgi:hypothetical protein